MRKGGVLRMFFDHTTVKTTGKLEEMTREELAELDRLVEEGVMISMEQPGLDDLEYANRLLEQQRIHGVGWGLRQFLFGGKQS